MRCIQARTTTIPQYPNHMYGIPCCMRTTLQLRSTWSCMALCLLYPYVHSIVSLVNPFRQRLPRWLGTKTLAVLDRGLTVTRTNGLPEKKHDNRT